MPTQESSKELKKKDYASIIRRNSQIIDVQVESFKWSISKSDLVVTHNRSHVTVLPDRRLAYYAHSKEIRPSEERAQ